MHSKLHYDPHLDFTIGFNRYDRPIQYNFLEVFKIHRCARAHTRRTSAQTGDAAGAYWLRSWGPSKTHYGKSQRGQKVPLPYPA